MSRLFDDVPEGGAPGRLTSSPVQDTIDLPTPIDAPTPRPVSFSFDHYTSSPQLEQDELADVPSPITPSRRRESVASVWSAAGRSATSTVRLNNPPTPGGRRPPSRKGTIGGMSVEEVEHRFVVCLFISPVFYLLTPL